jgi:7-carboxy-7-deazaguanine synthase
VADGLVISEVFGPTVQGEGPSAGQRAAFVRLGTCNLNCSWCDTPYTWDWSRFDSGRELRRMPAADVARAVAAMDVRRVVLTGGEPLLQQGSPSWEPLVRELAKTAAVEVETNGTQKPVGEWRWWVERFNVSPKLQSSGVDGRRLCWPAMEALRDTSRAVWKFVMTSTDDFDEVDAYVGAFDLHPHDVWVMPEGRTAAAVVSGLATLVAPAIERGYNVSSRMQVLMWGDQRGH